MANDREHLHWPNPLDAPPRTPGGIMTNDVTEIMARWLHRRERVRFPGTPSWPSLNECTQCLEDAGDLHWHLHQAGYQIVPIEPSDAMHSAANAIFEHEDCNMRDVLRAAIQAHKETAVEE